MLFLDEMVARTERHQMCVVCWRRYGHAAGTPNVRVTQLIGQHLQLVGREHVVIPQYMVVGWTGGALEIQEK